MIDYLSMMSDQSQADEQTDGCICTVCGYTSPDDTDSCLNCGTSIETMETMGTAEETTCPHCQFPHSGDSRFCAHCGADLSDLSAEQPDVASSSRNEAVLQDLRALMPTTLINKINAASGDILNEQREVTVLAAQMSYNPTPTGILDDEDIHLLISEVLPYLAEVVYNYEGTVDAFTGNGLLTLFGAPVTHENDPERAVRAALEMQSLLQPWLEQVQQEYGVTFQLQIGLNTGQVIAGKVGNDLHMAYTVVGETVSLAEGLAQLAAPNAILTSTETYQRTQPIFEFTHFPAVEVEGQPNAIAVFQPLYLLEKPRWGPSDTSLPIQMIGRAPELAALNHQLTSLQETGPSQIALITGAAGLGKSRLVAEFVKSPAPVEGSMRIYQGSCTAYARSAPLALINNILRDIFQLSGTETPEEQYEWLHTYLVQRQLATPEILPYLAFTLGLEPEDAQTEAYLQHLEPDILQKQTHAALRQVFLAEAALAPTLLIFDNLHWIDAASRDFLIALIQTTADAPLMTMLVSRTPDRESILQPLIDALRQESERLVEQTLHPLSERESHALIDHLIRSDAPEAQSLKGQIVKRAEGNPFYIEEIIRVLTDQGGLERSLLDGSWQVTAQAHHLLEQVPGTVKGVIMARLDQLPEGLRHLLQRVAVFGPAFPTSHLPQISHFEPETLELYLSELEERQFLKAKSFRAEPGFAFQHALIQETIYQALLKRDRRHIHTQVAQAIARSTLWLPEERAEALAYHYAESTTPAEAVPHLITAAENAARRCAYETAVAHYRQAMDLNQAQPAHPTDPFFQIRVGLGRALKFIGELAEAYEILSATCQQLGEWKSPIDPADLHPVLIECLHQLADVRQRQGTYEHAIEYLETGLQLLDETGSQLQPQPHLRRLLLDDMAWVRFRQGKLDEAAALVNSVIDDLTADETADHSRLARLYNTLGGISWQQGRLEDAVTYVERSLHLHEQIGYLRGRAVAYSNLGVLYCLLGRWPQASTYYHQAYTVYQTIGATDGQANSLDNLGVLHTDSGEHTSAQQELETSLALRRRMGDNFGIAQSLVNLAQLALNRSQFEAAATHAQAALSLADSIGGSEGQIQARWILALVRAEGGDLSTGLQLAHEALNMAQERGLTEKETECLRVLGTLQAQAGNFQEAELLLNQSAHLAEEQNACYRQGLAQLALGRLYLQLSEREPSNSAQRQSQAGDLLTQAQQQFASLGAAFDLQHTQTLLANL